MLNTALIGFGLAGKTFHAPLLSATKSIALRKIMTSKSDEAKALYPDAEVINDFEQALTEDIDLIVLATPNKFHFEQAQRVIEAKKSLVVDKPLTPTLKQAKEIEKLANEKNVFVTVFHNRRFDGDFLTIKNLINQDRLGRITYFESNFHRFRPQVDFSNWRETTDDGGGVFFDLAPHLIDQAVDIFGPPLKVFADLERIRDDAKNIDAMHLIMAYDKKRIHLNASTVTKNPMNRFVVHGTRGSFTKKGMDPQEQNLKQGMQADHLQIGQDQEDFYGLLMADKSEKIKTWDGHYLGFYQNIVDVLENKKEPIVSLYESVFVMELMQNFLESHQKQKWVTVGLDI